MSLASFGVKRPVVVELLMWSVLVAGLIFGVGLRKEFFPEVRPSQVLITAPYPGAAPGEVEEALAVKIEDRLADLSDIEEIRTTVREGAAIITVEYEDGVDIEDAVAEVKRELDSLQDLPDAADRITITKLEPKLPAVIVSLYGESDEREMKRAIREIRDDLRSLPGMGEVSVGGFRNDEITVEARPAALIEHRLSLAEISGKIAAGMRELPGGAVRTPTANFGIRTMGSDERASTVRDIVVQNLPGGRAVRLGDVAEVRDGFADTPLVSRLNGKPAVNATVYAGGDDDIVEVAEMAKAYVKGRNGQRLEPTLTERLARLTRPPGSSSPVSSRMRAYELGLSKADITLPGTLTTTTDLARFVTGRLDLLTRNALQGGVLVFLTLVVFLNWRVSVWVTMGMIISLAGTLVLMRFTGITLNLMTMFGLIIVVGILVDDAIVVAENIAARHERGEPALVAAVRGANEIAWPVVGTVLTTVVAFIPLALIEGQIGDFMGVLPVVVGCALLVSVVESVFILPSHLGHTLKHIDDAVRKHKESAIGKLERRLDAARERWIQRLIVRPYARLLALAVPRRYTTLLIAVAGFIVSIGMVAGGRLEFIFFEDDDAETVSAELRMPVGTPLEATEAVARRIEAAVAAQPEITSFFTTVGAVSALDGGQSATLATDAAQVVMELKPIEDRGPEGRASPAIIEDIRDRLGPIPGARLFRIDGLAGGPSGAALSYALVGDRIEDLELAATRVAEAMASFEGVVDIATDIEHGQRELQIDLREGATELGFTREFLGRQVQGFAFGLEAFTFAGDQEDVDVRVLLPESVRRSPALLEQQYVFTPSGDPVPLAEVARITEAEADTTIHRLDRRRVVRVTADIDSRLANPERVSAELGPRIDAIVDDMPGVSLVLEGRQKDLADSFSTLPLGFLVAAGLIYVILAWLFGDFTQPLIVMTAIPFAVIGVVWGHVLLGYKMTFLSLIGFVALAGIVVNDSLIFMEFFNTKRREGLSVAQSILATGPARVRAILLTTITTVLGLLPLILERSFQARFLIPMAITIAFGLISATGLILIVLPCLLMILSDIKLALLSLWRGERVREDVYVDPEAELRAALEAAPQAEQRE